MPRRPPDAGLAIAIRSLPPAGSICSSDTFERGVLDGEGVPDGEGRIDVDAEADAAADAAAVAVGVEEVLAVELPVEFPCSARATLEPPPPSSRSRRRCADVLVALGDAEGEPEPEKDGRLEAELEAEPDAELEGELLGEIEMLGEIVGVAEDDADACRIRLAALKGARASTRGVSYERRAAAVDAAVAAEGAEETP